MNRPLLALLLTLTGAAATTHAAPPSSCGGGSSLYGEVIISGFAPGTVRLQWTVWEDSSVREYRLSRLPSGCDRASCATRVARVRADGDPAALKTYTIVDTALAGTWIYRLEVRRARGESCVLESAEVLVLAPPPCDSAALCAQVEASFLGSVIVGNVVTGIPAGTVRLQWLTHAESGAGSYRLSRSNCANPRDCSIEVATVNATGQCGQVMLHSVTDAVPNGTWAYGLEVLDSGGRAACTMRLPAPASPASSR